MFQYMGLDGGISPKEKSSEKCVIVLFHAIWFIVQQLMINNVNSNRQTAFSDSRRTVQLQNLINYTILVAYWPPITTM